MDDATTKLKFLGMCWAQWAVILRETIKFGGFIAVTNGVLTGDQAAALSNGLTMLGGGGVIVITILYQVWKDSIPQRIKEVSELPNVKGVVADPKTANIVLADAPKVVDDPTKVKP